VVALVLGLLLLELLLLELLLLGLLLLGLLLLELLLVGLLLLGPLLLDVTRNDYRKVINCLITKKVIEYTRCNRQCFCVIICLGGDDFFNCVNQSWEERRNAVKQTSWSLPTRLV
jgi:hypothetical protein